MLSPKLYQKQISELGIEGMIVLAEDADEASQLLEELQKAESILSRIRINIRMDIRAIRREFIEKIKKTEQPVKGFNVKEKIEKSRLKEKKHLIIERDLMIAAYESIEDTVEDYLAQIQHSKVYLLNVIHERS